MHFTSNFTSQLMVPTSDRFEIIRAVLLLGVGLTVFAVLNHKATKTRS